MHSISRPNDSNEIDRLDLGVLLDISSMKMNHVVILLIIIMDCIVLLLCYPKNGFEKGILVYENINGKIKSAKYTSQACSLKYFTNTFCQIKWQTVFTQYLQADSMRLF